MTPIYLVCYIVYTIFTSTILSIPLALRCLIRRISPLRATKQIQNIVALYEGTVRHERRHPVHHSFRFRARYALIDLDRPPYSPPNFLSAEDARSAAKTNGPVVGYERSPVNLYYCYDMEGSSKTLKKCIVEASNTPWGESVTFVFNPTSDLVPKSEYISPFMDMDGNWRLKVSEPGEKLYALVSVQHPKLGTNFTASLTAKRVIPSNIQDHDAFFWLLPHKVSFVTYWNAVELWWKNVPFHEHPRKQNPAYREETSGRDEYVQCCPGRTRIDRCFIWKNTKWPWSSCC
ncbi:UNVERIFIED_CONTAM: hypothetical protein Sindi_2710900 [Sesamum indicum]